MLRAVNAKLSRLQGEVGEERQSMAGIAQALGVTPSGLRNEALLSDVEAICQATAPTHPC